MRRWPGAAISESSRALMFEWITSVIARLGYLGVATLTFLENQIDAWNKQG